MSIGSGSWVCSRGTVAACMLVPGSWERSEDGGGGVAANRCCVLNF